MPELDMESIGYQQVPVEVRKCIFLRECFGWFLSSSHSDGLLFCFDSTEVFIVFPFLLTTQPRRGLFFNLTKPTGTFTFASFATVEVWCFSISLQRNVKHSRVYRSSAPTRRPDQWVKQIL